MYNGVINVYKEPGYTSHDVVAKLRGITKQKKIGHTGTLDPDAEGVLPVCLGAATRICDMLTDEVKEYEAVVQFGVVTDTQDMSGTVLEEHRDEAEALTEEVVLKAVMDFVGEIEQIPPMYSAIKQNGKKLYELARQGIEIERKPRHITIHEIEIINMDLPELTMKVRCSKGTYIRTLCHDIGNNLGCGAAMKHLTRTQVGGFRIEDAVKIDRIEQLAQEDRIGDVLVSLPEVFSDLQTGVVNASGAKKAENGNMLTVSDIRLLTGLNTCVSLHNKNNPNCDPEDIQNKLTLMENNNGLHNSGNKMVTILDNEEIKVMREDGFFYGVYKYGAKDGVLRPVKMFLC